MSHRSLIGLLGVALSACAAAGLAATPPAATGKDAPPAKEPNASPAKDEKKAPEPPRPALPPGWTDCDVPQLGIRAYVPPGFMVRLRSNRLFTIERPPGVAAAAAWIMPCHPKKGTDALELAKTTDEDFAENGLQYIGAISKESTPERATVAYTAIFSGQPCEGMFTTTVAADGTLGYALGVVAAKGRLVAEQPVLDYVAKSFQLYGARTAWRTSPGKALSLDLPKGWKLDTTQGKLMKNEIDWMAYDPKGPAARAFSLTPKFCTAELAPKLSHKGYRVGSFESPEQCIGASLGLYYPGAKVTAAVLNAAATREIGEFNAETNRFLAQLKAGEMRGAVYECEAEVPGAPAPLRIFFAARIDTNLMSRWNAPPSMMTDVCLRGWAAPADRFFALSPVLERITGSMAYSEEYCTQVAQEEAKRATNLRETDAYLRKVEAEIWRHRFATDAAIQKMRDDYWKSDDDKHGKEGGKRDRDRDGSGEDGPDR